MNTQAALAEGDEGQVTSTSSTIRGYDDLQPLGSGGFSQVFDARQKDLNRRVALKVIKPEEGKIDRRAFELECQAMGAVSNHPNIVTLYSHGFTDQGQPYLAMELHEETLLDRLRRAETLPTNEVLEIGKSLAAAIQRAHDDGIIHCDLKPHNVFFSEYGATALGDFGIAALTSGLEGTNTTGVTLHYAAPEVLNGQPPSVSTDIYSLGATLWTALAGRQPFRGEKRNESAEEIRDRVLTEEVPPISTAVVPERVEALLRRMLDKDPARRPKSASEVERLLTELQAPLKSKEESSTGADRTVRRSPAVTDSPVTSPPLTPDDDPTTMLGGVAAPASPQSGGVEPRVLVAIGLVSVVVLSVVIAMLVLSNGADDQPEASPVPDFSEGTTTIVVVEGPPGMPENLVFDTEDAQGVNSIELAWDAVERATIYETELTTIVGSGTSTTTVEESSSPVLEVDVAADATTYCARVRAVDSGGRFSQWSEELCVGT